MVVGVVAGQVVPLFSGAYPEPQVRQYLDELIKEQVKDVFNIELPVDEWAKEEGKNVILVRPETRPDDVHGMLAAKGVVTSKGGRTSHAALVARQFGTPAVVGVDAIEIEDDFEFEQFSNDIENSALLNLGLNVGNNTFGANTLFSRVTQSRTRLEEGFDGDALGRRRIRLPNSILSALFLISRFRILPRHGPVLLGRRRVRLHTSKFPLPHSDFRIQPPLSSVSCGKTILPLKLKS